MKSISAIVAFRRIGSSRPVLHRRTWTFLFIWLRLRAPIDRPTVDQHVRVPRAPKTPAVLSWSNIVHGCGSASHMFVLSS